MYSLVDRHLQQNSLQVMCQIQIIAEVEVSNVDSIEDPQVLRLPGPLLANFVQNAGLLVHDHLKSRFLDLIHRRPKQFANHLLGSDEMDVRSIQEDRKPDDTVSLAHMVLGQDHERVDIPALV